MTRAPKTFRQFLAPRFIVLALGMLALAGCQASAPTQPGPEIAPLQAAPAGPVKVAILLPLSGRNAALGQTMLNAAQMALFDTGAAQFELLPRDTGGTASGAETAARASAHDGAQLILGPVFAEEARAVKPVAQLANLSVIAFTTDWKVAGGPVFTIGFMPFDQAEVLAAYAARSGIRSPAAVLPFDEYGRTAGQAWSNAVTRHGMTASRSVSVSPSQDMTAAVAPLAQGAQADAVFLPLGGRAATMAGAALAQNGLNAAQVRRLGTGLFDDPALAQDPALAGAWFAAPSPRLRAGFESRYQSLYGEPPLRLASLAYDATALAAVLAKQAGAGDKPFDRAAIMNPNGFAGIDGIFRFRGNGMAERGLAVLEFRDGRIVTVQDAPASFAP